MRRATLLLVPLFLLACDRDPVQPSTDLAPSLSATSVREVFVDQFDFPAYNACLDEDMQLYVVLQARSQTVTTAKETHFSIHWRFLDGTRLVGSTTNDVWLPVPGDHGRQIAMASGDFTVHERLVFHNPTTGMVLEWSSSITFVINARGEVKVDRFNYLDDCMLRH